MIKAEIIADSKNEHGQRLTTFVLTFPRIVLAEFNTHRMFSRNSASSRAIPFKKMLKMVEEDPFIPLKWMKEHTGMQGTDYFQDEDRLQHSEKPAPQALKERWIRAKNSAIYHATEFSRHGLTKQLCNRLLEPFMWHTVIVTASEWENFFALRAHPAAEIHIQDLAHKMLEAYNQSTPKQLYAGDWHVPFGDKVDYHREDFQQLYQHEHLLHYGYLDNKPNEMSATVIQKIMVKIATARCARVSYLNFEGKDDYLEDVKLHDRLLSMGHMSPMEHCARAMSFAEYNGYTKSETINPILDLGWCGNFRGFIQYRKMLEGENKSDNRINKK